MDMDERERAMRAEEARERFRMAQPRMCLYCRGGWLVVPTRCAGAGGLVVACANAGHWPKQPKTIRGWKVPQRAATYVLLAPSERLSNEKHRPSPIHGAGMGLAAMHTPHSFQPCAHSEQRTTGTSRCL